MNDTTDLFYEDAKFIKKIYTLITVLLYIGAVISSIIMLTLSIIDHVESQVHTSITLERVLTNAFYLIMAIILNVYVANADKFRYYIEITNDNIKIFIKDEVKIYSTLDFKDYIIVKEHTTYSKFKLQFDLNDVFITTRKPNELKLALDRLKN